MEPADAFLAEDFLEIDHSGLHVAGSGVAPVIHGDAGTDAGADFGEIEADAIGPADAVELRVDDVAHVHANRAAMIENDSTDRVVDLAREKPGSHSESGQRVGDVVL